MGQWRCHRLLPRGREACVASCIRIAQAVALELTGRPHRMSCEDEAGMQQEKRIGAEHPDVDRLLPA